MVYLDFFGEGLLCELAEDFAELIYDGGRVSISDLEARIPLETGVAARLRDLGCRLLQDAKPARAREFFSRALRIDPNDLLSRLGQACALDAKGFTSTAIEELQLCLDAQPDYCPAIVSLGYCFQKSGKPREAIRAYEQALRKNPKLRRTRERLASIIRSACDEFPEMNGHLEAIFNSESHDEFREFASAR